MSFSATDRLFETALKRSLALLEHEQASLFRRLCSAFAGCRVYAVVEEEALEITGATARIDVSQTAAWGGTPVQGAVFVASDFETIDAVLEAELSLLNAVLLDRIPLVGALDDLLRVHEALDLYLNAAVRAPSLPQLLIEFRKALQQRRANQNPEGRSSHAEPPATFSAA